MNCIRKKWFEILAVDPDEIDRAAGGLAGVTLGQHAGDGIGGGGEFHMLQGHAVAGLRLRADEGDEIVDLGVATPGVPINGLALGLGQRGGPIPGKGEAGRDGHEGEGGKGGLAKGAAVHGASLFVL